MRQVIFLSLVILILLSSSIAFAEEYIVLNNPQLIKDTLDKSYELVSVDLRLPENDLEFFNKRTQDKLADLASLYGAREVVLDEKFLFSQRESKGSFSGYRFDIDDDDRVVFINPMPGVLVSAEYGKNEEDNIIQENTNISLNYWMNNKTLLRAGYGRENKGWWDIDLVGNNGGDLELGNNEEIDSAGKLPDNDTIINDNDDIINKNDDIINNNDEIINDIIDSSRNNDNNENSDDFTENDGNSKTKETTDRRTFNEEINETSRLGISYRTNDYLTISADYINDHTSLDRDYSTIFGLEYTDDLGSLRYHYQLDYGDEEAKETGLEFGYKDLATFNATYKIYNPKTIEEQLNQWDFGIGFNLNELSTLSFGYQLKQEKLAEDDLADGEEESNIKAQLEIKF